MTKEKIQQYQGLTVEEAELTDELGRIKGFFARTPDNKDNAEAINHGKIFCKFAGTACMVSIGLLTADLVKRKKEVENRLQAVQSQMDGL